MENYIIDISETLSNVVIIEGKNEADALNKAIKKFYAGEIKIVSDGIYFKIVEEEK